MEYEIITVETESGSTEQVVIQREDGSVITFPADPENPRYIDLMEGREINV